MENSNSNQQTDETIRVFMRIRPTIRNHQHISKFETNKFEDQIIFILKSLFSKSKLKLTNLIKIYLMKNHSNYQLQNKIKDM